MSGCGQELEDGVDDFGRVIESEILIWLSLADGYRVAVPTEIFAERKEVAAFRVLDFVCTAVDEADCLLHQGVDYG